MKSKNTFWKAIRCIEPLIIFFCAKEIIKLILHNVVMNLAADGSSLFGINWGQLKTFDDVSLFLNNNSIYITMGINIIFIIAFGIVYLRDVKGKKSKGFELSFAIKTVVAAMCISLVVTNLINISGIAQSSAAFQSFQERFMTKSFVLMLVANGIIGPISEEIVFRGLLYGRMRNLVGTQIAMIISAALFGLVHGNVVQFIFAGILGYFLAFFYEKGNNLCYPILGHIFVNCLSILMSVYGVMNWMYTNNTVFYGAIILYTSLAVIMVSNAKKKG